MAVEHHYQNMQPEFPPTLTSKKIGTAATPDAIAWSSSIFWSIQHYPVPERDTPAVLGCSFLSTAVGSEMVPNAGRDRSLLQILSWSMAPHQSNVAVALKLLKAYFAKQPSKSNAWSLSSKLSIDFKPNFGTHPKFVPGCPLNSHLTNSKCF